MRISIADCCSFTRASALFTLRSRILYHINIFFAFCSSIQFTFAGTGAKHLQMCDFIFGVLSLFAKRNYVVYKYIYMNLLFTDSILSLLSRLFHSSTFTLTIAIEMWAKAEQRMCFAVRIGIVPDYTSQLKFYLIHINARTH